MMRIRQFSAYAWLAVALLSGICYGSSYTRLSHLDCNRANANTDNEGAWVRITGYRPQCTERFLITFSDRGDFIATKYQCFFCARTGNDSITAFQQWTADNKWKVRFDCQGSTPLHPTEVTRDGNVHTIEWAGRDASGNIYGYIDDVKSTDPIGKAAFTPGADLVLFAAHKSLSGWGHAASYRFYDFIIRNQAGLVIHHFVPARDDGVANGAIAQYGVYDLVDDRFYPNIGTRVFLASDATECGKLGAEAPKPLRPRRSVTAGELVEQGGVKTMPLFFDNPGCAQRLFMAWGTQDGGATTNTVDSVAGAWEHLEELVEVGADETSRTVAIPAAAKKARFFLYPKLVGGQFVESLNSSGSNEYIDTGFVPDSKTRADATFEIEDGVRFPGNVGVPFGARTDMNTQFMVMGVSVTHAGFPPNSWLRRWGSFGVDNSGVINGANRSSLVGIPGLSGRHEMSLNRNTYILDGYTNTFAVTTPAFSCGCNMYVFTGNDNNNPNALPCRMKLNTLDVWDNDILVRAYLPCVKDDGTPALFDSVNGTFAVNAGTTPLTTGAIVVTSTPTLQASFDAAATARWTGLGDGFSITDPANWACTNSANREVTGVLPDATTVISIGNFKLANDLDFSALPSPLQIEGTVDLAGHTLKLTHFAGDGTITDATGWTTFRETVTHGGEYVLTDYVPVSTDRIETDLRFQVLSGTMSPWCARLPSKTDRATMTVFMQYNGLRFDYDFLDDPDHVFRDTSLTTSYSDYTTLVMDGANHRMLHNGKVVAEFSYGEFTCGGPLQLFASYSTTIENRANFASQMFMRRFQIYAPDNQLKLNLVPRMRNADNILGLYDQVSGAFYPLQGNDLDLRTPVANDATGVLIIDIPEGETAVNESIAFVGGLKLVKRGAGTFVSAKTGQIFTGGVSVEAGTVETALSPDSDIYAYNESMDCWGVAGCTVEVASGATFDTKGNHDYFLKNFVLNGGTLANSGRQMTDRKRDSFGNITLTASSTFDVLYHTTMTRVGSVFDLGGHELHLRFGPATSVALFGLPSMGTLTNGTIIAESEGTCTEPRMLSFKASADLRTVNIHQKNMQIQIDTGVRVQIGDYTSDCPDWACSSAQPLEVYGTFTPNTPVFYAVLMADGSRLDLRAKTEAWSTQSACSLFPQNRCDFADGATVTVDLSGRTPVAGEKIIAWTTRSNARFVWDAATAENGVVPVALADGLYYGMPEESGFSQIGSRQLTEDLDLSESTPYLTGTLDLNGHTLTLANFDGVADIVDTSANPGKIVVAPTGTFKASAIDRCIRFAENVTREILVPTGVTLDLDGTAVPPGWTVVMAGGQVVNSGATVYGGIPAMRLTQDSSIFMANHLGFAYENTAAGQQEISTLDLGGHQLTVDMIEEGRVLLLYNTQVTNGTLKVNNGQVRPFSGTTRFVDAVLEVSGFIDLEATLVVDRIVDACTDGVGNAQLEVFGSYKPQTRYYRWTLLHSGATLDLRDQTDVWTTLGIAGIGIAHNVYFEDNGYITVDCAGRTLAVDDKLVEWTVNSPQNVVFTLDAASAAAAPDVALEARADGLYVVAKPEVRRVVLDPVYEGALYSASVPRFAADDRLALAPKYADFTQGRFLLATWDVGTFDERQLATLFDATSAKGTHPVLSVTTVGEGAELWLNLDPEAVRPRLNVLVMGDTTAVTGEGCFRLPLMKMLEAEGYDVMAKGIWAVSNTDPNGAKMPFNWVRHSAMDDIKLRMTADGFGALDNVAAILDQAGDVDVVVLQYADDDADARAELVARVNAIRPHAKVFTRLAGAEDIAAIVSALKTDTSFVPGFVSAKSTTSGVEANVPAAEREGYSLARVFDIAANDGVRIPSRPCYPDYSENPGVSTNIGRVAWYIELKRRNDDVTDYGGEVRWLWAATDAFGNRAIDQVGIPASQGIAGAPARRLRVLSNMPGIASTPVGTYDTGSVAFHTYAEDPDPANEYAADHLFGNDWNDTMRTSTQRGVMQLSRNTPDGLNPAEMIFSYGRWRTDFATNGGHHEVGLGNFAFPSKLALDWNVGELNSGVSETMSVGAYEVARIEIWTMPENALAEQLEKAVWTGAAHDGDFANAANWSCFNAAGGEIAGALPDGNTTVEISGTVAFSGALAGSFSCADLHFVGEVDLTADLDLRGIGLVFIDGTVRLHGHRLTVDGLRGAGTIDNGEAFDLTLDDPLRSFSRWPEKYCGSGGAYKLTFPSNLFNNDHSHADSGRVLYRLSDVKAGNPLDIGYDFSTPTVIDTYRVWFGNGQTNFARAPSDWTFEGSNDNVNYTVLDRRERVTWMQNSTYREDGGRTFTCGNTTAYRFYRMVFTKSHSDATYMEFTEIEFGRLSAAGELCIDVPAGKRINSATVAFGENVRVVKEGDGELLATKTYQRNIFLDVNAGRVICNAAGQMCPLGQSFALVTIHAGGELDFNARGNYAWNTFVLDGGRLANAASVGTTVSHMSLLELTADSTIDFAGNYGLINNSNSGTLLDLNGHTLTIRMAEGTKCFLYNADVLPGTIDVEGHIEVDATSLRAEGVTFNVTGALDVKVPATVGNCMVDSAATDLATNGVLTVKGVFAPKTDNFPRTTLANGATLDLRGREEILDLTTLARPLTFAASGTIAVALDAQTPRDHGKLVGWDEATEPGDGVVFTLAPGTSARGKLRRDDTGLYWETGLVIFVR